VVPADAAGSGIGLFVCRRLVTAMGGRIWSNWSPEGRSEVGFALPAYRDDDRRLT
jgi:signal transduction histidine kinase